MSPRLALGLAAVAALAAPAAVAETGKLPLAVTNATERVAFCTVVYEGKARTNLAIRPGMTWSEAFDPRRRLQLVCNRARQNAFGPLEAGKAYRIVTSGRKLDLAEASGE